MSEVNERTQRTSLLRGPVTDIPGLTSYIATNFVSLTGGGNVTGEVFIASGGALYLYDPVADTDRELTVVDGDLFVGGVAVGGGGGGGDALTTNPLSQFAATTSAQLAGVISDETGSGALVFATSPTLTTPTLGVASCTSLAVGANVTIVRNATGPTLETRAAGGLKVCNANGSASAPVSCSLVDIVWNGTNGTFLKYTDNSRIFSSASSNTISIGSTPVTFNVSAGTVGPTKVLLQSTASTTLSNTNVVLRPNSGVLEVMNAAESANAAVACSNLTASGYIDAALRPFTVAGLPLASASDGKEYRVTDSTLAMTSANYGSTPSGGGSNKVRLFSNGTAWLLA